nr:hypothetical protein [uncultured Flavobacterium sp.]
MITLLKNNFYVTTVTYEGYQSNKNFYDTLDRTEINYDSDLGFLKPKLEGGKYIEGATADEIETYNDQFFAEEISRRQLRLQWQLDGRELSEVDNYIEAMPKTTEDERISKIIVKNAWNESITFSRKDPLMQGVGIKLLGSKQNLNEFFNRASQH